MISLLLVLVTSALAADPCGLPPKFALDLGDRESRPVEAFPFTACTASETVPVCLEITRHGCEGQLAISVKSADRAGAISQVRKATSALVAQATKQGLTAREPGLPQVVRVGQHFVVQSTEFVLPKPGK